MKTEITTGAGSTRARQISEGEVRQLPTPRLEAALRVGSGDMELKRLLSGMFVQFPHPRLDDLEKSALTAIFLRNLRALPIWAVTSAFRAYEATGKFRPQVADIIELANREAAIVGAEIKRRRQLSDMSKPAPERPPEAKRAAQGLVGALFPQIVASAAQRRRETEADLREAEAQRQAAAAAEANARRGQ